MAEARPAFYHPSETNESQDSTYLEGVAVSKDRWEAYKNKISFLYRTQGKPLREVMEIMDREHNFKAS